MPQGLVTYNPADPAFGGIYELTIHPDRLKRVIDANTGEVIELEDRHENKVTFKDSGIESNRERELKFERDRRGNITKITDPRGNSLYYQYDSDGNLVAFYDRVANAKREAAIAAGTSLPAATATYSYLGATAPAAEYAHFLDTIADANGMTAVDNQYRADGRLEMMVDAAGEEVQLNYDLNTLTQTITDQNAKSGEVQFDTRGNVLREQNQLGEQTVRTYDPATDALLTETRIIGLDDSDPGNSENNDLTTTYQVNAFGQPTLTTDPMGNATGTSYDGQGLPDTTTDPLGNKTHNYFDPETGDLLSTTDGNGNQTSFQYDAFGGVVKIISGGGMPYDGGDGCYEGMDPDCDGGSSSGVVTQFEYDKFGDLVKTIDPQENERTISYDANGNQTGTSFTWTDPDNSGNQQTVSTGNVPNENDRVTSSTSPSGTTTTDYDALGRPFKTTDQFDRDSQTIFDTRGLTIESRRESTDESGATVWLVSRSFYDAAGRATYATNSHPEGTPVDEISGTHTIYDDAGQVTSTEQLLGLDIDIIDTTTGQEVSDPAGSGVSTLGSQLSAAGTVITTTSTSYDDGRVTETTDSFLRQTRTLYDRFGQTIETRTQSRRDLEDGTTEDVWLVSRTVYDRYGRAFLTTDRFIQSATGSASDPSPPVYAARNIYDDQGRVVKTERLKNVVVEIQGATGSASAVVTIEGTVVTISETIYNNKGQVERTIAADGQITDSEYDDQGRQVATVGQAVPAEDVGLGATHAGKLVRHRTETEYNSYGQTFRQWSNIAQVEDANGNVLSIDNSNSQKAEFKYDQFGNRVQTTFADDSFVLARYDNQGRQTAESQQVAADMTVEWSDTDKSFIESGSDPVVRIPTKLYEYDSEGRLAAVELPAVSPSPDHPPLPLSAAPALRIRLQRTRQSNADSRSVGTRNTIYVRRPRPTADTNVAAWSGASFQLAIRHGRPHHRRRHRFLHRRFLVRRPRPPNAARIVRGRYHRNGLRRRRIDRRVRHGTPGQATVFHF
ncbi:MAG: hypothetical protein WD070_07205 [Pirellulaceae bacterium]